MDEILHIKNLSKCYGDTKVLKNINISVKKGEVVVIIGPSGCGKKYAASLPEWIRRNPGRRSSAGRSGCKPK